MRNKSVIFTIFVILLVASFAFGAEKYTIDTAHSSASFKVKHLVISNTKGDFKELSGVIWLDEANPANSSVEVIINVASLDTDNDKRDGHLRSPDFFDAEKYPNITFKSTKVVKDGDGYMLTGNLTIKDVTKEVSFPFEMVGPVNAMGSKLFGAHCSLTINRQDYGVSWNRTLDSGGLLVGNEVKIELEIEAKLAKEGTN